MATLTAGVDLGGTYIKVGLVTTTGQVVRRHRLATHAERGAEAVADRVCRGVIECAQGADLRPHELSGVGVGSPGTLNLRAGVVEFSPNLPLLNNAPLRQMVSDRLQLPVALENDANAAALAESWLGAGRQATSLVLLTLGTGIGGGIVLDGRVWHGVSGVAGELGHVSINPDGPLCGCGNHGCIEAYASATAMVRRLRETVRGGADSSLAGILDELTAADIYRAALDGDAVARQNIEQTGRYLGVAVSNLMHLLNPAIIAFSGGVTAAGEMLMTPLRQEARKRTMAASQREVRVRVSELPDDAGIIGAARCAMLG